MDAELKTIPVVAQNAPDCGDKDEDCPGIKDKAHCWVYAPERGMCPYLRTPSGVHPVEAPSKNGDSNAA